MPYTLRAHETLYRGVRFRSRLEARWAAFFDLVEWNWKYEPIDLEGWTPDFWVSFPCGHSECPETHELYVEVKPYYSIKEFDNHIVSRLVDDPGNGPPHPAMFGIDPSVVSWQMVHGAGGGYEGNLQNWTCHSVEDAWTEAGNLVRWRPR